MNLTKIHLNADLVPTIYFILRKWMVRALSVRPDPYLEIGWSNLKDILRLSRYELVDEAQFETMRVTIN
jgi:hypothetical protein